MSLHLQNQGSTLSRRRPNMLQELPSQVQSALLLDVQEQSGGEGVSFVFESVC